MSRATSRRSPRENRPRRSARTLRPGKARRHPRLRRRCRRTAGRAAGQGAARPSTFQLPSGRPARPAGRDASPFHHHLKGYTAAYPLGKSAAMSQNCWCSIIVLVVIVGGLFYLSTVPKAAADPHDRGRGARPARAMRIKPLLIASAAALAIALPAHRAAAGRATHPPQTSFPTAASARPSLSHSHPRLAGAQQRQSGAGDETAVEEIAQSSSNRLSRSSRRSNIPAGRDAIRGSWASSIPSRRASETTPGAMRAAPSCRL